MKGLTGPHRAYRDCAPAPRDSADTSRLLASPGLRVLACESWPASPGLRVLACESWSAYRLAEAIDIGSAAPRNRDAPRLQPSREQTSQGSVMARSKPPMLALSRTRTSPILSWLGGHCAASRTFGP